MNKKIIPILIAVVIIAGGAGFFAGMKYGQSKSSATVRGTSGGFANLSPEERQVRMQQFGGVAAGGAKNPKVR